MAKDGSVKVSGQGSPSGEGCRHGEPLAKLGEYITIQEFADWLRIGKGTAWSLVMERGEIPHLRFGDRVVRLARADVEAYLRRCRSDAV